MIEYRLLLWVLETSSSTTCQWRLTNAPGLPQSPDCNVPNINAPQQYDELLKELTTLLSQPEFRSEGWRYRTCYTRKSDLTGENSDHVRVIIERDRTASGPDGGVEGGYCHQCGAPKSKTHGSGSKTSAAIPNGTEAGPSQASGSGREDPPAYTLPQR